MIEATIQNPEKVETLRTDSQGRVNLGVTFADREVELVVVRSEDLPPAETAIQYTIGDRPMLEHERAGMVFARVFGVNERFLRERDEPDEGDVGPAQITPTAIDWSEGHLVDPENVALFGFDDGSEPAKEFLELLTAEPARVTRDDVDDTAVYRFENEHGEGSALAEELVHDVGRVYGYDPAEELSNVRVHPDDAPTPVSFRDPNGETYVAIAPIVSE